MSFGAWQLVLFAVLALLLAACLDRRPPAPRRPKYIADLSPRLDEHALLRQYGRKACEFFGFGTRLDTRPVRPENELHTFGFSYYELLSHAGAHLDAPSRLLRDGPRPADIPLDNVFGWARRVDLQWHDRNTPITVADLENYKIRENEIVLLHVGYTGAEGDDWPQYPYLSAQAAQWLASTGIRALGTDMPSVGSLRAMADLMEKNRPPEEIWAAQVPFFQHEIPVIEGLVNLGALEGEARIFFAAFPLPLTDRSGSPVRAVALVYE